jgi:transcriptional regulator with GAF, ATPase, and Fis domain
MTQNLPLVFIQSLFEKLDPDRFPARFLEALTQIQNVERGSMWIRRGDSYVCSESIGPDNEKVKGLAVSATRPSIVGSVIETGKMRIAQAGKDPRHFKEFENDFDVKSTLILCFPLKLKDGSVYGAVQIIDTSAGGKRLNLAPDYLELMQGLVTAGGIALSASLVHEKHKRQNVELKKILEEVRSPPAIVGRSKALQTVLRTAETYAGNDFPVMITGESGTGKELVAREIHRLGARRDNPFLAQNCSAIPDTLLESELFGYRKGAFTGATRDKVGLFEAARGGTVFLDEIGDMPLGLQAKILHVLQSNEIKPLGSTEFRRVDMRILSATNRNMTRCVESGLFREDLYFRLNVLPLVMPPLRSRKDDIPLLLSHFLRRFGRKPGRGPMKISPEAMGRLTEYLWPGNIREMENLVKYLVTVTRGDTILPADLTMLIDRTPEGTATSGPGRDSPLQEERNVSRSTDYSLAGYTWEGLEREYIQSLLDQAKWNIAAASRKAGIKRSTFNARMRRLGIRKG